MTADDHCHEDMGDDPCGAYPVGYRIDVTEDKPYPVCRTHLRGPYWLTARDDIAEYRCQLAAAEIKLRAARLALAACREVREAAKEDA